MLFIQSFFIGSCYSNGSVHLVLDAIQPVRLFRLLGLSEILSHSELTPDTALTLTLARKRYNVIQSQYKKVISSSFEARTCSV